MIVIIPNRTFGYDAIHRLTTASGPWGAGSYTYDANGNRQSKTEGANNTTYAYTAGTNRLATATGSEPATYGYDANGNTTSDGTHTYQYSQRDRLATVDSGTTGTCSYDGDGRRVKKVASGVTTIYFYDPDGKLLEEYIPSTGAGKDYVWLPGSYEPLARVDFAMSDADNGNVLRVTKASPNVHLDWSLDGTSGPFVLKRSLNFTFSNPAYLGPGQATKTFDDAVLNNGQSYAYEAFRRTLTDTLYFYHADHLGTPIAVTNGAGTLVWRAEHTPFGGIYALTVGTITNNLRFPGQYLDGETGLSQNLWRDYQAKLGRYAEPDPVGRQDAPNPFPYAGNSPTIVIDPMGLKTFMCTKPLHALEHMGGGMHGRKSYWDVWGNPLYHEYLCVISPNGTITCGGQDRGGSGFHPQGKPSDDHYSPENCDQVAPDDSCLESCLLAGFDQPRPTYNFINWGGTNCQKWANDLLASCQHKCQKKPVCTSTPRPQPKTPDPTK